MMVALSGHFFACLQLNKTVKMFINKDNVL